MSTSSLSSQDQPIRIIAGPCSIDHHNIDQVLEIAEMTVQNVHGNKQKAVSGTRIVGMKSRTNLNPEKEWIGLDYAAVMENMNRLIEGHSTHQFAPLPSAQLTRKILEQTHLQVATEIIIPSIQLAGLAHSLHGINSNGRLMVWNPAVNQLGGQVLEMVGYAKKYGWKIGLKNGKWLGEEFELVERADFTGQTSMEKTWVGLHSYAQGAQEVVLIHRGCDIPDKNNYRNVSVHFTASRAKQASSAPLLFDPSHIHGPNKRDSIVPETIAAMQLKMPNGSYLYDGVLIEVGTAKSDTAQHISLPELQQLCNELAIIRGIEAPTA